MLTNLPKITKSKQHEYLRKGKNNIDEQFKSVMSKVRIRKNELNEVENERKSCTKIFHKYRNRTECKNKKCDLFKIKCEFCKKRLDCFNREFEKYLRERKMWGKDFLYKKTKPSVNESK